MVTLFAVVLYKSLHFSQGVARHCWRNAGMHWIVFEPMAWTTALFERRKPVLMDQLLLSTHADNLRELRYSKVVLASLSGEAICPPASGRVTLRVDHTCAASCS